MWRQLFYLNEQFNRPGSQGTFRWKVLPMAIRIGWTAGVSWWYRDLEQQMQRRHWVWVQARQPHLRQRPIPGTLHTLYGMAFHKVVKQLFLDRRRRRSLETRRVCRRILRVSPMTPQLRRVMAVILLSLLQWRTG